MAASDSEEKAEVLLETKIDALDITVLRGGGDEVGRWAPEHGFFLSPDAPEVLDVYAARSPVFMAARFDALPIGSPTQHRTFWPLALGALAGGASLAVLSRRRRRPGALAA